MLKPFQRIASRTLLETPIFTLREDRASHPVTGDAAAYYVLENPDWVNIVALTTDGSVVLVRQWRHGSRAFELGIPAGMVDPGESALDAAARELAEETGYVAERLTILGDVRPNAAYQQNRCVSVLSEGCRLGGAAHPDAGEDLEVVIASVAEVVKWMRDGTFDGALGLLALYLWRDRAQKVDWTGP